jgi:YidC/Oxa1 family membrane protein insertase
MKHLSEIKNVFFAFVLALIVLIGWQFFFDKPKEEAKNETKQNDLQKKTSDDKNSKTENPISLKNENIQSKDEIKIVNQEIKTEKEQIDYSKFNIQIENDKISGIFSPKGLSFEKIILKDYKKEIGESEKFALFEKDCNLVFYSDFGFVPNFSDDEGSGQNLGQNNKIEFPNQNTLWKTDQSKLESGKPITLKWKNDSGIEFETKISLDSNYLFKIERTVRNKSNSPINFSFYGRILRNFSGGKIQNSPVFEGFIGFWNNEILKFNYQKLFKKNILVFPGQDFSKKDELHWAGFSDKYWLASIASSEDQNSILSLRTKTSGALESTDALNPFNKVQIDSTSSAKLLPGKEISKTEYLFVGAKELTVLDSYEKNQKIKMFDRAVDFGLLYFITKPIFVLLQYFNKILGNFGLAIMLLTLVIKFLLFPLSKKSVISASKMKEINPEIEKLKEKYKDDKLKLNAEIINLFKKNKVSPLSPLLPILFQLPIFFALYKVLSISIEMRHAAFFGWIKDLSAKDTINIFELIDFANLGLGNYLNIGVLSIFLGLTMFVQQKFQPAPTDQSQKTIMTWMPWIFIIISASFPAGLIVYWAWNNLVSIAQQLLIERFFIKKKS